ncbi:Fungal-trans domain-containing protein [Fusarium falciforme]|uniref:Fungal-trans domain-containing protein n=1 Tax=Fusarium falciforme TaxID=195108 RepID=UPI0023013320|nr:Fungal-trans domain-containing protein [Fusarium falciforme]WAO95717.1 Fungal-trans domain-containing protein [Fusarium falciforme]
MLQANSRSRRQGPLRRRRVPGTRAHQACLNCKEKKLKCDDQNPACGNCKRLAIACLIQDPKSKKTRPRNYLEVLEGRVASLEGRDDRSSSGTTQSPLGPVGGCSNGSTPSTQLTPDNGEGTSDLSSRVGMLDFRTTQMEPQYLGSSSAFAFSRIINFSLSRDLPSEPTLASLNNRHASPPSPCLLPDYEVALTLSNAYFKHIHPQYPFLHEPTFRAWEARHYGSSHDVSEIGFSSSPLFFLNMVYAVASLLLPNTQSLAEQLYMSAQLFTDILSKDNLESIQALLCYAMYSLRSMDGPSLWKLSGLALRQCIELGYHRGIKRLAPTANPLQQEMRRRVFWVANGIDCTVALRLGRPLGIPIQEIDAEYPSDVDDSAITEAGITSPPRSHHSQPATTMSTAIHVFKLRHIWAQIHTSLFSGASRSDVEHGAWYPRIRELRAELDTWLAEAPPSRPRQDDDLSIFSISTCRV